MGGDESSRLTRIPLAGLPSLVSRTWQVMRSFVGVAICTVLSWGIVSLVLAGGVFMSDRDLHGSCRLNGGGGDCGVYQR